MSIFIVIAYLTVALTGTVVLLSVGLVLFHALSTRRERRTQERRLCLRESLVAYLEGKADEEGLKAELLHDRDLLVSAIEQLAEEVDSAQRAKLEGLFQLFGMGRLLEMELENLSHGSWPKRMRAATRLAYMGSREEVVPHLLAALEDDMLDVRLAAAHSLAKLEALDAVVPILRHLILPAQWPIQRVTEILYDMGDAVAPRLLDYLDDPDAQDAGKAAAIRTLGMRRATGAVAAVVRHLSNPDIEVRVQSAKALGEIGDAQAAPALQQAMHDPAWEVRAVAANALGQLRDEAALAVLATSLADSAWWVRFNAAHALAQLGTLGTEALGRALVHTDSFVRDISRQVLEERGLMRVEQGAQP